MNKASSALLATAGITVGLLGFALPAGASVNHGSPHVKTNTPPTTVVTPNYTPNRDPNGHKQHKDPCYPTKPPCTHPPKQPCDHRTPPCDRPESSQNEFKGIGANVRQHTTEKKNYICKVPPCKHQPKPCHPKCKRTQPHKRHHCKPGQRVS